MTPPDPQPAETCDRLRAALRKYAVGVDSDSWHGELMQCELCGETWNNGKKRNEPATPEVHKADCLLSAPAPVAPPAPAADPADDRCRACDGSGLVDDPPSRVLVACRTCEGTGKRSVADGPAALADPADDAWARLAFVFPAGVLEDQSPEAWGRVKEELGRVLAERREADPADGADAELRRLADNKAMTMLAAWHARGRPAPSAVDNDGKPVGQSMDLARVYLKDRAERDSLLDRLAAAEARVLALLAERDALAAELDLWKPLTPAQAEAALDAAEAVPLSEARIAEMVAYATDPANTLSNSEQAQLAAAVKRLTAERDAAWEAAAQKADDYGRLWGSSLPSGSQMPGPTIAAAIRSLAPPGADAGPTGGQP